MTTQLKNPRGLPPEQYISRPPHTRTAAGRNREREAV